MISRPTVKKKVRAELGNLGSIERAIERLFKTLVDWEVICPDDDQKHFKIRSRTVIATSHECNFDFLRMHSKHTLWALFRLMI